MANYLFDKYNVTFGPWSGEVITSEDRTLGGEGLFLNDDVGWDGNKYYGIGDSGYYGMGSTGWMYGNGSVSSYREKYNGGNYNRYNTVEYRRTRSAYPSSRVQIGLVGTINQYPINSLHHDGFWYIRTGIENAPIITSPNGGESVNELFTITFSDNKPTAGIRYQIQLSLNNGQTWKDIIALTTVGVSSYLYNFINEPATSTAKVRVRAYDGQNYGTWDESNGVFTIQHNVAPTTPTNLTPSGIIVDRTKTQRLTWKHNDDDAQSKAVIEWRPQGATTWNTITSSGSEQGYYIATNTFPGGQIEWRVRTYDQQSLVSPYSGIAVFTSAEPTDAPVIIQPSEVVPISRPVVQWSGGAQASYQIVVVDSLDAIVWDSGEIMSANKALTVGVDLINGGAYTIKVRIKDGGGLFSSFAEKIITISYTPPAKSSVSSFTNETSILLDWLDPQATGTQPLVESHDVYKLIKGEWIRIAVNAIRPFEDYTSASKKEEFYKVRANGENGTISESDVVSATLILESPIFSSASDNTFVVLKHMTATSKQKSRGRTLTNFAGRDRALAEFGESQVEGYGFAWVTQDRAEVDMFYDLIDRRETMLYRDAEGRKDYVSIDSTTEVESHGGATFNLSFDADVVWCREEV